VHSLQTGVIPFFLSPMITEFSHTTTIYGTSTVANVNVLCKDTRMLFVPVDCWDIFGGWELGWLCFALDIADCIPFLHA